MSNKDLQNRVFSIVPPKNSEKFMIYSSITGVLVVLGVDEKIANRYKMTLDEIVGFMKISDCCAYESQELNGDYLVLGMMGELPVYTEIRKELLNRIEG